MLEERLNDVRSRSRRSRQRSLALVTEARRRLAPRTGRTERADASGRVWLNGRELGAPDGRFAHLGASHD